MKAIRIVMASSRWRRGILLFGIMLTPLAFPGWVSTLAEAYSTPVPEALSSVDLDSTHPDVVPPYIVRTPIAKFLFWDLAPGSYYESYTARIPIEDVGDRFGTLDPLANYLSCTFTDEVLDGESVGPIYVTCKESSPAWFEIETVVPPEVNLLSFDLQFINGGDGDWLTVFFNDDLLMSVLGNAIDDGYVYHYDLPITEFADQSGSLFFYLNSVGDPNAQFQVGNIAFSRIPLPPTVILLITGLIGVYFTRRVFRRP